MKNAIYGRLFAMALAAAVVPACGGASRGAPPPPAPMAAASPHAHGDHGHDGGMCPMEVTGTTVDVTDTADGVALTFTTADGDVAAVRQRVHHLAEMHGQHMAGGDHDMAGGDHGMAGGNHMMMVPSTARAEDVEHGARLVLTPVDPARLADLREHVRMHASQLATGKCPMMGHHG